MKKKLLHLLATASLIVAAPAFAGSLSATITTEKNAYYPTLPFTVSINPITTGSGSTLNAGISGTLPAVFVLTSAIATAPWSCTATGQAFNCTAPSLPIGPQPPITLNLTGPGEETQGEVTASLVADVGQSSTVTSETIFINSQDTCRRQFSSFPLGIYQSAAFSHKAVPIGGTHENRPGTESTYAFRLCNTTATAVNNVVHHVVFPAEVIPEPSSPLSSPGWTCTGDTSTFFRCSNATNESALAPGWAAGGAARRELHYRIADTFPPDLFSIGGLGCGGSWCPPQFDPDGNGVLSYSDWDGGTTPNSLNWSVLPAGVSSSVVTFGTPWFFDRAGLQVSNWQPEGRAIISVVLTGTGDLTRDWALHQIKNADSVWMTQNAGSSWDCSPAGMNNFPNAPTEFSVCRTLLSHTETPRGLAVTRTLILDASASAPVTGNPVGIQFCSGTQNHGDYGFGETYRWGPSLGSTDLIGNCNTILLPFGTTTPVSLQSFTID